MTTQRNKENYSRRKARKIAKQVCPDLKRYEIVHHEDLNPFNNNLDNLMILSNSGHMSFHTKLNWSLNPEKMGRPKSTILQDLVKLEKWLTFYNNNYAI